MTNRHGVSCLVIWTMCVGCQGDLDRQFVSDRMFEQADASSSPADQGAVTTPRDLGADDMSRDMVAPRDAGGREDAGEPRDQAVAPDLAVDMVMVVDAGPPMFEGTRQGVFARHSCDPGCAGNPTTYTSIQQSPLSIQDAERLAHLDVMANGQAHADQQGTCECAPATCGCDVFQNHGQSAPHLYYNAIDGELTGEVFARCAPEFWVEGSPAPYAPMIEVGKSAFDPAIKLYRYWVSADTQGRNVHLRSREQGCMDYPDIRNQPTDTNRYPDWIGLPDLQPLDNASNGPIVPLFISGEFEGGDPSRLNVWTIGALDTLQNRQYRVNGGGWVNFDVKTWGFVNTRPPFDMNEAGYSTPPKDFIMDLTRDGGQTIERYTVYRTSQGGHYSMTSTMTRHDGHVLVSTQLLNAEVAQKLIHAETGAVYTSTSLYNHSFDLGMLPEGDHLFSLWTADDFLIDKHVLVKVKKTL